MIEPLGNIEREYVVIYISPFDLQCPYCEQHINPYKIKSDHRCPICGVKLKGKGVEGII